MPDNVHRTSRNHSKELGGVAPSGFIPDAPKAQDDGQDPRYRDIGPTVVDKPSPVQQDKPFVLK